MSQLRTAGKPSAGEPDRQNKLNWADFVQLILELTIQAYKAMREDNIVQRDWEENVFTIRLGEDYIRPVAFDAAIRIDIRNKVHTERMKIGEQKTICAKEMDLSFYDIWEVDYLKKRFVWEAKRIGDKKYNLLYENLIPEYVNEAICRFIRCEYADGLEDAGILGYVLAGNATDIVADINRSMGRLRGNPPLLEFNHLILAQPVGGFKDIYDSRHTRTDNTGVRLHHLFLNFNFK